MFVQNGFCMMIISMKLRCQLSIALRQNEGVISVPTERFVVVVAVASLSHR